MKYVTVAMIAQHAGRHHQTVFRALKATGTATLKQPGVNGLRILKRDADRFLELMWPDIGPMKQERTLEEEASR